MSNVLNLAGATPTSGFEPLPSGRYDANVYEVEAVEIEKDDGKLPQGTPGINVQFAVDGGEYDNRRLWRRYYFPPDHYEKAKTMKDMIAGFFVAIGYTEEEVTSGNFVVDLQDMAGRPCELIVGQRTYDGEIVNEVKSVKPRGSGGTATATPGGIL
jgi:Protein of unknown function (DUF669)